MTIAADSLPRNDYLGNGTLDTYDFGFRIYEASNLLVKTRSAAGVESTLTYPTDYSISGVNVEGGGSITLTAGNLASGVALSILFDDAISQPTDVKNQGALFLAAIETGMDRLTRFVQMVEDRVNRSVRLPVTEAGTEAATVVPTRESRKNKFSAWDNSGNITPAAGTSANLGPVSGFIDTLLPAADAAAARAVLAAGSEASVAEKTGDYTVVAGDRERLIVLNSAEVITLNLTAAATLGAGFRFHVWNRGVQAGIIDPAGTELINGPALTHTVMPGSGGTIMTDGTRWYVVAQHGGLATQRGHGEVRGLTGFRNPTTTSYNMTVQRLRFPGGGEMEGAVSLQVDALAAGPVNGGRDQAGAFPNPSWVHLYAIWQPGSVGIVASLSDPTTGPTLPSGWIRWAYLTTIRYTTEFAQAVVVGRAVTRVFEVVLSGGTATTLTYVPLTDYVPTNAVAIRGYAYLGGLSNGSGIFECSANLALSFVGAWLMSTRLTGLAAAAAHHFTQAFHLPWAFSNLLSYQITTGSGSSVSLTVNINGYDVENGS